MRALVQHDKLDAVGVCPVEKGEFLLRLAVDNNLQTLVEIGVWKGSSLMYMAEAAAKTGGKVYGIDPYALSNLVNKIPDAALDKYIFESLVTDQKILDGVFETLAATIKNNGLSDRVSLIRKTSADACADFAACSIDLLHVDGNHDEIHVTRDLENYVPRVKPGGYIVMDDCNWPGVKKAINKLLAPFTTLIYSNGLFAVYQKLAPLLNQTRHYGIVLATYRRADGSTPHYLTRAVKSVLEQTYQNFTLYVVGDKYEPAQELNDLIDAFDSPKIKYVNLPVAKEREKYTGEQLWSYGGVTAMNLGIGTALSDGIAYVFHLDHDDWWRADHIALIDECIRKTNAQWVCSKSNSLDNKTLFPDLHSSLKHIYFVPKPSVIVHSSVCMNFKTMPFFYRDLIEETGQMGQPADSDLWIRVAKYMRQNKLLSFCVNEHTCYRDEACYAKKHV